MVGKKKQSFLKRFFVGLFCFLIVGAGVFFGVQFFTKTGIFRIPGVVYYDESLTEAEKEELAKYFTEELDLDKDVTISARNELKMPELEEGEFLVNIKVPVVDFYEFALDNVDAETADALLANPNIKLIDLDELNSKKNLIKINNKYYLDSFNEGGVYRIISFRS